MLLHFYIKFSSRYGDNLQLNFHAENGAEITSFPLSYLDDEYWDLEVNVSQLPQQDQLIYSVIYQPEHGPSSILINQRIVDLKKVKRNHVQVIDGAVKEELFQKVFHTTPFERLFAGKKTKRGKAPEKDPDIIFKVKVPPLAENMVVCLLGSSRKLKEWKEHKPLLLQLKGDTWSTRLNLAKESYPLEYKFGIYDTEQKKVLEYEEGDNRILKTASSKDQLSIFHASPELNAGKWKGAGVNIAVSAIRTEQTWGIGDFTSLHQLVDWSRKTGMRMIQLLPLNDTSATLTKKDSYPYAPISVFALHPLYLNVQKLATAFGVELALETLEQIHELNALPYLDYEKVLQLKMQVIRELYAIEKQSFKDDFAWFEFFDLNRHWLVPYAAFCFLRDKYGTADVMEWKDSAIYNEAQVQEMVSPDNAHYDDIALHYFIQYHLHLQLKDATDYAHKHEVFIKGDLPIGVGRCSVDTWMFPNLFHLGMQAGAPPDAFSTNGQNWNFPTYNWSAMGADNYAWWRQRMEHMENYFDAVRIDHVLGFYRIWSIPLESADGILGRFEPAIPLYRDQFEGTGLYFNEDRFCRPYINDDLLSHWFGERKDWVKDTFMYGGHIKEEFASQQKVIAYFKKNSLHHDLERGILNLLTNVILLKDPVQGAFHFRINMFNTDSYKNLPFHEQQKLEGLYHAYFFQNQNQLWDEEGRRKLTALRNCTRMLLCAEDLGMVPEMVEGMLNEMQILSLQVQRMPKSSADQFSHPRNASYLSVVTPSTHDMSTIREWWEEDKEVTRQFFNNLLGLQGDAPSYCEPWIGREIIKQHLQSPAMWSVFLLQDLLACSEELRREDPRQERINDPSNPDHTWDYRMHLTLEKLIESKNFSSSLKTLVTEQGR